MSILEREERFAKYGRKFSEGSDGPRTSRLPQSAHKCWSKIRDSSQTAFRALGFYIIVSAFNFLRHPYGKGLEERTKISLHKHRSTALLRALIHVIPIGVALWEISLNINTYYIGSSALNLVYYQLAAKAHEMMIHASLAAVVFSYVRHEMTLGNGLAYGTLFSGLQIHQVSYLWSMEFWGAVRSEHFPLRRKLVMMSLISLCCILAAAAGPSSAILLVPRLDYWQAGSTNIWMNATLNDIWPDRLEGISVPVSCTSSRDSSSSNDCPSSEWSFIQQYATMWDNSVPEIISETAEGMWNSWPLQCQLSGRTAYRQFRATQVEYTGDAPQKGSFFQTGFLSTTQQAAIADALAVTANLWSNAIEYVHSGGQHGSIPFDHQIAAHSIGIGYFQPYSIATCVRDTILGSEDRRPISFPISAGIDFGTDQRYFEHANSSVSRLRNTMSGFTVQIPSIEYPLVTRSQLSQVLGSNSSTRVKWIELPRDLFPSSSIGVVILPPPEFPDLAGLDTTSDMLVCNVAAGWGSSVLNATTFSGSVSATSSLLKSEYLDSVGGDYPHERGEGLPNSFQQKTDKGLNFLLPHFPSKVVEISEEWAEYLNPTILTSNSSLIEHLSMEASRIKPGIQYTEFFGELILSSLVTNGLARVGFNSQLQGSLKLSRGREPDGDLWYSGKGDVFEVDANQSKDWVKLRVDSMLKGYAYNCNGSPPKVAVAFMLTYCAVALVHLIYSGISGISSTCWDSIAEVTALAMNSTPTTALRNTCAGISEICIFKLPVRILAMRDLEGEGEHLELVFGDMDAEQAKTMSIKPNRKYGTMAATVSALPVEQHHLKAL